MGPCIAVRVELHPSEIQQARLEGRSAPQPVMASALIDTGASITVIDQSIQMALDPAVVGVTFLDFLKGRKLIYDGAAGLFSIIDSN